MKVDRTITNSEGVRLLDGLRLVELGQKQHYNGCTTAKAVSMAEAASTCFESLSISNPTQFSVFGDFEKSFDLTYLEVTDQMKAAYNDFYRSAEDGAYGLAFLLLENFLDLVPCLQSARGNGFDYHLGRESEKSLLGYEPVARMEATGILKESKQNSVEKRFKEKLKRFEKYPENSTPAYVVVVEYSKSKAKVGKVNV